MNDILIMNYDVIKKIEKENINNFKNIIHNLNTIGILNKNTDIIKNKIANLDKEYNTILKEIQTTNNKIKQIKQFNNSKQNIKNIINRNNLYLKKLIE
jgi:hypothetical protein